MQFGEILLFLYLISMVLYTIPKKAKGVNRTNMDSDLNALLNARDDARNELKQRIAQRDSFAVQFIVIASSLLTLACSEKSTGAISIVTLALLPIVTLFYTILIDSSYRVHARLVEYINTEIEPKIDEQLQSNIIFWEGYCKSVRKLEGDQSIGGRKIFFHIVLCLMPIITGVIYYFLETKYKIVFIIYCIIMFIGSVLYLWLQKFHPEYTGENKLAFCDYESKKWLTDDVNKALFLDRDGTLHVDKVMTHRRRDLKLLPGAKQLIKDAHKKGYKVIIVTNQSGIGKGYYSIMRMHLFNNKLRRKLRYVDAIYFCPHTKDAECKCRKPNTGMIARAREHFNLDLSASVMVGDKMSDIITAENAKIPLRYFVTTGIYNGSYEQEPKFNEIAHETVHSLKDIKLS